MSTVLDPSTVQHNRREAEFPHHPVPEPGGVSRRRSTRLWVLAAAIIALAAAAIWYVRTRPQPVAWTPAPVERGTVARTVSATGRIQALTTVQVGTQVSGTVSDIYADFNDRVKRGQIIARLDPSQLQAQLTQSQANLTGAQMSIQSGLAAQASADAAVQAAAANVDRLQALVEDAQRSLERTRELMAAGVIAKRDLDTAQTAYAQAQAQKQQGVAQLNQARAQAQAARSQVAQARAQAAQAQAAVQLASVNLEKTVIRAPIDGVIVARNVDVGQTVAASFQAPVLFLIANDLTRMQVLADIDEADVGQLREGIPVNFTVDAYPRDNFEGQISQIRLSPQTVQNVVTYTAVIDVANPDGKLKPGMTANINAISEQREDVLTIPNAALRFRPETEAAAPQPNTRSRQAGSVVYRVNGTQLEPVPVRLGLSDGTVTEIVSGELREGDRVATPNMTAANRGAQPRQSSPFTPQRPRGGGRR
jgi:HlyD family secretion protein